MFSQQEILEDFVEAGQTMSNQHYLFTDDFSVRFGFGAEASKDKAAHFLAASEEVREQMRKERREIPKDEAVMFLRSTSGSLTPEEAAKIPALAKAMSGRELARRMKVSHTTIQRIVKGQWRK